MTADWHRISTIYFRWMGILALVIQIFILSYAAVQTRFDIFGSHTLSDLGRSSVAGTYALAFTLGGICLLLFVQYLRISYQPTAWFSWAFMVGIVCLMIVGSVPDKIGQHIDRLHTIAALVLITCMVLTPELFSLSCSVPASLRRGSRFFFYLFLLVLLPVIGLALTHHLLAFSELLCLAVFDAWVVYVSLAGGHDLSRFYGRGDRT